MFNWWWKFEKKLDLLVFLKICLVIIGVDLNIYDDIL